MSDYALFQEANSNRDIAAATDLNIVLQSAHGDASVSMLVNPSGESKETERDSAVSILKRT